MKNNKLIQACLESSTYINCNHPDVRSQAQVLNCDGDAQLTAKKCFEFVRDEIQHSLDFKRNPITSIASDVLKHGTGYCYAKSHLLAALLRANNIPAGLCYQRLTISNDQPPFCLHGLNAIYLEHYGWYRVDARGNKTGVDAAFTPPIEKLAFSLLVKGEKDYPGIYAEPWEQVIQALATYKRVDELALNLPDSTQ